MDASASRATASNNDGSDHKQRKTCSVFVHVGNFLSLATIGKEEGSLPLWPSPRHRVLCPREDSTESGNDEKGRRSLVNFAYPPPGIALNEARNVVSPVRQEALSYCGVNL